MAVSSLSQSAIFSDAVPSAHLRSLHCKLGQIDSDESSIGFEEIHAQHAVAHEVSFANLQHLSKLGNAFPGGVQELSGERVQHEIDTASSSGGKHACEEGSISRVEDAVLRNLKCLLQIPCLFLVADGHKDLHLSASCRQLINDISYLGTDHPAQLDSRESHTSASGVDQDGLAKDVSDLNRAAQTPRDSIPVLSQGVQGSSARRWQCCRRKAWSHHPRNSDYPAS